LNSTTDGSSIGDHASILAELASSKPPIAIDKNSALNQTRTLDSTQDSLDVGSGIKSDTHSVLSDWTVHTEPGDSTALKVLPNTPTRVIPASNASAFTTQLNAATDDSNGDLGLVLASTESFERERYVTVQKDMLTSAWSGRVSNQRNVSSESVLQPSHFLAATERRNRHDKHIYDQGETTTGALLESRHHSNIPVHGNEIQEMQQQLPPPALIFEQAHHDDSQGLLSQTGNVTTPQSPLRSIQTPSPKSNRRKQGRTEIV
jgi:hypothetical protein